MTRDVGRLLICTQDECLIRSPTRRSRTKSLSGKESFGQQIWG